MELAVADIGGTHARFARAVITASGAVSLDEPLVLKTDDYPDLAAAWRPFLSQHPGFEPQGASLALAGPVAGDTPFKLTNNDWAFEPASMPASLGVKHLTLLNDFAAIAHGIAAPGAPLELLAGPEKGLPSEGTVTVIGPGTGLGIAHIRFAEGRALIQATEGSHVDFAPINAVDDAVLARLRGLYPRVSLERVISGSGIAHIYAAIAALEGGDTAIPCPTPDPLTIWQAGLARGAEASDPIATRAARHFVTTLGRVAGDYALAHGASAVVIAGGLGLRLADHLRQESFHAAFCNKGRYRAMMERMPILLATHEQPGLVGAAYAFAAEHGIGR